MRLDGIGLQYILREPDEPLDYLLLLPNNVKHDIQLIDYVANLTLEFGLGGYIEKGKHDPRVDLVFNIGLVDGWVNRFLDIALVDCGEALREAPQVSKGNSLFVGLDRRQLSCLSSSYKLPQAMPSPA